MDVESEENELTPSRDNSRSGMTWTERLEDMLKKWKSDCEGISEKHYIESKSKKRIHYSLSIPCIFVPLFMGFTNQFFGEEHVYSGYMNSIGYLISGGLIGLSTFLNYGAMYVLHEVASNRYSEVCLEIESILIKKKKYRANADIILERIKDNIESLNKFSISI